MSVNIDVWVSFIDFEFYALWYLKSLDHFVEFQLRFKSVVLVVSF